MAYLTVLEGNLKGQRFELRSEGPVTLGRNPSNDIVVVDPSISGTHCEIRSTETGFRVRDLNSTNGTRLNDRSIEASDLHRHDTLTLGSVPFAVDGDDVPPPPAKSGTESSTATRIAVQPHNVTGMTTALRPKDFNKRHDSRRIWLTIIISVGLLIVLAFIWYIHRLIV